MNCSWCAKPAKGQATEPEDTSFNPSCGSIGCGIFFRAAVPA